MHPVQNGIHFAIGRPHAAVQVERVNKGKYKIIPGSISILRPDTIIVELPDSIQIIDEDGEEIKAVNNFYISTSTIDPYHMVLDFQRHKD